MSATRFSADLVEQRLDNEFGETRRELNLLVTFSFLAIGIACLGLFASATFNVERRTREIGIRKVLGAEIGEIVRLLLWQFSKPVLFANLIAWPLALLGMLRWLQRFPYQIDTIWLLPICALAGAIALLIACLTTAAITVRAAAVRPVQALSMP